MFLHDPQAVLDYTWDWAAWLAAGETISAATIAPVDGITVGPPAILGSGTSVTAWISGGSAGQRYCVTCHIVTTAGRQDDRTIVLACRER